MLCNSCVKISCFHAMAHLVFHVIQHHNHPIFFIRADAEEKYGKALIKLAEGAKGKDEIGYGLISNLNGPN